MLTKAAKLIRKLLKLNPPEPKAVLKLVKTVPEKRFDVNIKMYNGELIHYTMISHVYLEEIELDLGPGFNRQAKFLWLLNQNGLTKSEYNNLYLKEFKDSYVQEPNIYSADHFITPSPGTHIDLNDDHVVSRTYTANNSSSVQLVEHKVKDE